MAKASTHGAKFTATGGFHITSDDMFKSLYISIREKEIEEIEKDKRNRMEKEKFETDGRAALSGRPPCCPVTYSRPWKVPVMDGILWWYGMSKVECGKMKKPKKSDIMKEIINGVIDPPPYEKWSTENKTGLVELKKKLINMEDTALGRHQAVQKREMEASIDVMNSEERQIVSRKLDIMGHSELTVAAL